MERQKKRQRKRKGKHYLQGKGYALLAKQAFL
jgi:hypothetical protein